MREFIPIATRFIDLPAGFAMKRGSALHGARIAYEAFGQLNEARNKVILILMGLSPDAPAATHAGGPRPGWWEAMLRLGKPIDTDRCEAIRFDPHWNQDQYDEEHYPQRGMVTARKLGVITYRSALEWNSRFGRACLNSDRRIDEKPLGLEFEVESYLDCHTHRFLRCFDPNSYRYLSRYIAWFYLGESCGNTADEALYWRRLEKALVIGVQTDILFPLQQQRQIAEGLSASGADARFLSLESPEGHDAFLVDTGHFGPPVEIFCRRYH